MKKIEDEDKVKLFWRKRVLPFLQDDEQKWEDLPLKEKKKVRNLAMEILLEEYDGKIISTT